MFGKCAVYELQLPFTDVGGELHSLHARATFAPLRCTVALSAMALTVITIFTDLSFRRVLELVVLAIETQVK